MLSKEGQHSTRTWLLLNISCIRFGPKAIYSILKSFVWNNAVLFILWLLLPKKLQHCLTSIEPLQLPETFLSLSSCCSSSLSFVFLVLIMGTICVKGLVSLLNYDVMSPARDLIWNRLNYLWLALLLLWAVILLR